MNVKKIIILAGLFLIVCAAWTYADTYHYSDRIEIDGDPVMVSGSPWTDSQSAGNNSLTDVSELNTIFYVQESNASNIQTVIDFCRDDNTLCTEIVIPRGTYDITTEINITGLNDTWLHGVGAGTELQHNIAGGAKRMFLHETGDLENLEISHMKFTSLTSDATQDKSNSAYIRIAGTVQDNIKIHDLLMTHPSANHTHSASNEYAPFFGIQLNSVENGRVYDNDLINFGWYPLEMENCVDTLVESNMIKTAYYGISGGSYGSRRNTITKNKIFPATNSNGLTQGIMLENVKGEWSITYNTILNATGTAGINYQAVNTEKLNNHVTIENNNILHADNPIKVQNANLTQIINNVIVDSQAHSTFVNISTLSISGGMMDCDITTLNVDFYSMYIPEIYGDNSNYTNTKTTNAIITNAEITKIQSKSIRDISTQGRYINLNLNNDSILSDYVLDSSSENNHGIVVGASFNSSGGFNEGGAYEFDGDNDYIYFLDDSSLEPNEFSIACYLNPNTYGYDNKGCIVDKDGTTGIYWNIYNTHYNFYVGGDELLSNIDTGARIDVDLNEYSEIVATFDENNILRMYKNGVLEVTSTTLTNPSYSTANLYLGNKADLSRDFNGTIDNCQFYNRALSGDEVSSRYEQRQESNPSFVSQKDIKVNTTAIYPQNNVVQYGYNYTTDTAVVSEEYYGSGNLQGITNTTGLWICTTADCSTKEPIVITDGLITSVG